MSALTVEVSYDAGVTWRPAPITRTPSGGVARVGNPDARHVSFRAQTTDSAGNTVDQTITEAYRTAV
ncbi:hypothetical protein [Nonomuraea sp. NPDC050310]|uniref:hypothetical protein n=1 Tax=Nonomuraea sp. NPDC050310 TaxID=3154935 RepID=UPI003400BEC0